MADPMTTITGAMRGTSAFRDVINGNFEKRRWCDPRFVVDAAVTIVDSDEWIIWSATTAARACVLPDASDYPGREIEIFVLASDAVNTATISPTGADTVDGGASLVVVTNRRKLCFRSNGVSDWVKYEST